MNVLEIVLPVLVMIVVGMLCRKWKILTRDGINNMKVLVTNVMLPVAIFHALATAEYNKETGILILIMFVMLVVSFGLENGEKIDVKKLFFSALKTPAFIASILGIIAGLSKVILAVLDSPFGGVYQSVENILTTSVTAIILLVVGYSMELNAKLLKPCIATIILRVLLQAVMIAGVLVAVHYLVGDDRLVNLAIISYMSAPATFSMQTFMKDEEGSAYVSTTNSMYCLVSILVYIIMAVTIY